MSLRDNASGYMFSQKGNLISGTNRTKNNIDEYFTALKGVDIEIVFFIQDSNGHSIDLTNKTVNAILSKPNNNSNIPILSKRLIITDYDNGSAKLLINDVDTINIDAGYYKLNIIVRDENDNLFPVNKNLNFSSSYTLEILDNYISTVPNVTTVDTFSENNGFFYSDKIKSTSQSSITTGISTASFKITNFIGSIGIEGTLSIDPSESDWFNIPITVFNNDATYNNFTGIDSYVIEGLYQWVRFYYITQSGSIDKINYMV